MNTLIRTILSNKDYFKDAVKYRHATSPNKNHHEAVINAIDNGDDSELIVLVLTPSYRSQLQGVVYCASDYEDTIKTDLIEGFREIYGNLL